jgi:hypothetical protein
MLRSKFVLILGALSLTACTTALSPTLQKVQELVPGISTGEDAIAKLGPPTDTSKMGDRTVLLWTDDNASHPIHIAIMFGMDGRMIQVVSDAEGPGQSPRQ